MTRTTLHAITASQRPSSNTNPLFSRLLLLLLLSELRDLHLHVLVHPLLQLRTIAKEEQDLHPHKQRSKQQGLGQVVEQRRGTTFEFPVSNKLRQP